MTSAGSERCALESISHIEKRVCLMWGSPELDLYISRLIMDARDGQGVQKCDDEAKWCTEHCGR